MQGTRNAEATEAGAYLDMVHRYPLAELEDPRVDFVAPVCQRITPAPTEDRPHLRDHVVNGYIWSGMPRCPGCWDGGGPVDQ